jgi:hypothetical protein
MPPRQPFNMCPSRRTRLSRHLRHLSGLGCEGDPGKGTRASRVDDLPAVDDKLCRSSTKYLLTIATGRQIRRSRGMNHFLSAWGPTTTDSSRWTPTFIPTVSVSLTVPQPPSRCTFYPTFDRCGALQVLRHAAKESDKLRHRWLKRSVSPEAMMCLTINTLTVSKHNTPKGTPFLGFKSSKFLANNSFLH